MLSSAQVPAFGSKHQCVPVNLHLIIYFLKFRFCFILGKVKYCIQQIAFEAAHVVDNGCTVVARAGRVHPGFEGLGLVKDLSNFIIQRAATEGAKSAVSVIGNLSSPVIRVPASSSPKRILTLVMLFILFLAVNSMHI